MNLQWASAAPNYPQAPNPEVGEGVVKWIPFKLP
jgi:hypothetical protein